MPSGSPTALERDPGQTVRVPIGSLVSSRLCVEATTLVSAVEALFEVHAQEDAIAVVDAERVGLVSRSRFFLTLGRRFGFALYERRPVRLLMESGLVVDAGVDSMEVVGLALRREAGRILDDVIVTQNGRFAGLVSMRSLTAHHKDLLARALADVGVLEEENRRLEDLRRLQSELVAHLTHELRNPVTVILGVAEHLLADAELAPRHAHLCGMLLSRASDLRGIIDQMLDMAKLEAGALVPTYEDVDVEALLHELVAGAQVSAAGKTVVVEAVIELPARLRTDSVLLRQIVGNLLSNAVKFTDRGRVLLRAHFGMGALAIEVADTGPGIRSEDLRRLFTKFSQLETTARKRHSGTGLGLAIVKGLAELLDGSVAVASQFGEGATFSVRLPTVAR
jgi:signal transduction histidine kinase